MPPEDPNAQPISDVGPAAAGGGGRPPAGGGALQPLRHPMFRAVWVASLASNFGGLIQSVAAAWQMTQLAPSAAMVALVQASTTLPVVLFSLAAGAAADNLDRRRLMIVAQLFMLVVSAALAGFALMGWLTPWLLLTFTFLIGCGSALNGPAWQASVGDLVPRPEVPAAVTLNAVGFNLARSIGPALGGAIVALFGAVAAFALNALTYTGLIAVLARWRPPRVERVLPRETLGLAMSAGVRYVAMSPNIRRVLLRGFAFGLGAIAVQALLPLVARGLPGGSAGTFTVLLAAMGAGAIFAALNMPRIRAWLPLQRLVLAGTVLQALGTVAVAYAPNIWFAVPAMLVSGVAWITVANSLTVAAQMALPDWVRARGMSIYQMCLMGSTAAGAAFWGQVATWSSVRDSLSVAAFTGVILMLVVQRLTADRGTEEDLTPSQVLKVPEIPKPPRRGRIRLQIEYLIDPARESEFLAVMQESRRSRLAQGALDWELLHDITEPGRYVEQITDESWTEHLRRFDRITAADAQLRDRRLAFHVADEPPRVTRYLVEAD